MVIMKKFLILCLFLIIGCQPVLHSGRVVLKTYFPPFSQSESVVVSRIVIKNVTIPIYGTEIVHYPAKWEFVIENEVDGKLVQRTITVSKEDFEKYNFEDWLEL